MCGLAGIWHHGPGGAPLNVHVRGMARALTHRGPDDEGVWCDENTRVALAHRRLAIVDLSPAGHQPMSSPCGRFVLVFNGEIYNHRALRKELADAGYQPQWRGEADTEVLLAAITHWGLRQALERCVGMFALALWDKHERRLSLARDRMGEKPLYFAHTGDALIFGSELKALTAFPGWQPQIDQHGVIALLRYSYIPAPQTIYQNARKVCPGEIVSFASANAPAEHDRYWSADTMAYAGQKQPFVGNDAEAIEALDAQLREAVRLQMVADVPLGAFLSGGIDSSTVVALMQAQSSRPVKTFSIGFADEACNEADHARAVARHLGTDHTELYVDAQQALAVIPRLPQIYDEPFADCSQIPTFIVAQLARQHVTVSLSGDGGDELFDGYDRYTMVPELWGRLRCLPLGLRRLFARGLVSIPAENWNRLLHPLRSTLPRRLRVDNPGDKLHKLASVLDAASAMALYRGVVSLWQSPADVLLAPPVEASSDSLTLPDGIGGLTHQMMYQDLVRYLPDDILVKLDRAAMAVSLETRAPLLDHRLVEFAWRLPAHMKRRAGQGKWVLRQVLDRYVPRHLVDRPKAGFGVPLDVWLRGPLRDWAESLLDARGLHEQGIFNAELVRHTWHAHLNGGRNLQHQIWNVLMFQAWHQHHHARQ